MASLTMCGESFGGIVVMAEIRISFPGGEFRSPLVDKLGRNLTKQLKIAIRRIGVKLERQSKKNLSGPSHTRFPGNPNPFPGVLTGRLRQSVTAQFSDEGLTVRVGPDTVYARAQEYGMDTIPARPYLGPALTEKLEEIRADLRGVIGEALR